MKLIQTTARSPRKPVAWRPLVADYVNLTKPRIVLLLLLSTLVAMLLVDDASPSLTLVFWTMVGGYFAAGGAGALNCALEGDIDQVMDRTGQRPVAAGRISSDHAFRFGMILSVLAFLILAYYTTIVAALLAMLGVVYYVLVYTHWLKRRTWLNIVIGGGAGALPPLVGSAAVTGSCTLLALVLAAIIFFWSPPHFWSLALVRQRDYALACVPMLPVVAGDHETRRQIIVYTLLTVIVSFLLIPFMVVGWGYAVLALLLNGIFLAKAWQVYRSVDRTLTRGFFRYTIVYLTLLFLAMILDKVVAYVLVIL